MNYVTMVGRLVADPEIVELEDGKKVTTVTLAINRNYKNADGVYDTDFIRCVLWNQVASTTTEYCRVGDIIGVKGRLQNSNYEDKDGNKHFAIEVIAERVTFLQSSRNKAVEKETADREDR